MTDQPDAQFGSTDCTCIPWTRQDGTPRYCGPHDTVDMIGGWQRGRDCPHHSPAPPPCVHPAGYEGECPCKPSCGCCTATAAAPAPEPGLRELPSGLSGPGLLPDAGLFEQIHVAVLSEWLRLAREGTEASPAGHCRSLTQAAMAVRDTELEQLREQVERVRKVVAERRTELAEYEAEHEPSAWSDAVSVTCSRIDDALRVFPEPDGIPDTAPGQPREQP
jgi:transposase-like protein